MIEFKEIVKAAFGAPTSRIKTIMTFMFWCRDKNMLRLAKLAAWRLQKRGVFISIYSKIDGSLKMPHPIAIVIGDGVIIGENVRIYQGVTLGGARVGDGGTSNYPKIGSGSVIFAGAIVIGGVSVGKNCTIGANSVVLHDIPDDAVCVGAPARIIRIKGNADIKDAT